MDTPPPWVGPPPPGQDRSESQVGPAIRDVVRLCSKLSYLLAFLGQKEMEWPRPLFQYLHPTPPPSVSAHEDTNFGQLGTSNTATAWLEWSPTWPTFGTNMQVSLKISIFLHGLFLSQVSCVGVGGVHWQGAVD